MKITIPSGFKIGHFNDDYTGTTVILSKGAVAGCDCRGGAPGTRETDLLRPEKAMQKINAVVLTGGSAYGLASTVGVMDWCRKNGIGYKVNGKIVPIVCGAVIYDLNQHDYHLPSAEFGFKACENASKSLDFGNIGVGKGATVGKIRGLKHASKGGVGAATVKVAGITVTAVVAVNALGDVVDENGKIIAGAKANDGSFLDTEKALADGEFLRLLLGTNTTIGCILTNAKIDKVEANKLASISHEGLARSIRPVHTDYDGDTMFCMSCGKKPVANFAVLESAVVKATVQAIINAVTLTKDYDVEFDEETEE